jgi:uncharacterized RDD family membrane protein YckC
MAKQRKHSLFLQGRKSSPLDRLCAKAVDILVVAAVFSLLNLVSYFLAVIGGVALVLVQDGWGQSVGKRLFGLYVLADETDAPGTLLQSILRNVPLALGLLFGSIPVFWVFFAIVFVPLIAAEFLFLIRIDSGTRLGDVLAETYVSDAGRRPISFQEPGKEHA